MYYTSHLCFYLGISSAAVWPALPRPASPWWAVPGLWRPVWRGRPGVNKIFSAVEKWKKEKNTLDENRSIPTQVIHEFLVWFFNSFRKIYNIFNILFFSEEDFYVCRKVLAQPGLCQASPLDESYGSR